ncbi:hypothetical protein AN640_08785 [Candidatus Epulonipiscium fishelsonii]|uniref:Uncharacterized protein n=1 Tax=Candidatus Epulonipiscium fishelsonii TaxID=77094 RepID=A0ACC8XCF9_9FIRM|nr:hypothetical protein AN640_08785 [Epulopiscium sp. SCG-D08WGA-EpuloA1]
MIKFILILLAILLTLLGLIICWLLFASNSYSFIVSKNEIITGEATFKVLELLKVYLKYIDGKPSLEIFLINKKLYPRFSKEEKPISSKSQTSKEETVILKDKSAQTKERAGKEAAVLKDKSAQTKERTSKEAAVLKDKSAQTKEDEIFSSFEPLEPLEPLEMPEFPSLEENEIDFEKGFKKTIEKESKSAFEFYKGLWDVAIDSEYKTVAWSGLYRTLRSIVKIIKPNYIFFDIVLGLNEYEDTGRLIAKISAFAPCYARYGSINGNFTEKGIWGNFEIEGKFNLYQIVRPTIVLILNYSFREYIKEILRYIKNNK